MSSLIKAKKTKTNDRKTIKNHAKRQIDNTIGRAYRDLDREPDCRNVFEQILCFARKRTDLLKISDNPGRLWPETCMYVRGLRNLSARQKDFIRPVQAWRPLEKSRRKVFASLAHHFLAEYNVPFFMNSAWLRETDGNTSKQRDWYVRLGRGHSIRKLNMPVRMTKKTAHLFSQAADHLTVEEAMRYSQVLGLGGKEPLANAIIATRLGRKLENEDFWETTIRFLVNLKDLDYGHVNPIIDFLHYSKFAKREVHTAGNEVVCLAPPDPGFSLKGRTISSLMRLVGKWHQSLAIERCGANYCWPKSAFNEYRYLEETHDPDAPRRIWSITELLSGAELALEGKLMRHCVSTYATACFRRRTTIWSMKREFKESTKRVLTIELDPTTRTVRQARGKCNVKPDKKTFEILRKWARKEGLKLGSCM